MSPEEDEANRRRQYDARGQATQTAEPVKPAPPNAPLTKLDYKAIHEMLLVREKLSGAPPFGHSKLSSLQANVARELQDMDEKARAELEVAWKADADAKAKAAEAAAKAKADAEAKKAKIDADAAAAKAKLDDDAAKARLGDVAPAPAPAPPPRPAPMAQAHDPDVA